MLGKSEIIALQLASLGLIKPPSSNATQADVINSIRQMGILQIDTISVVNRSPYFVLWSRLGNYDPTWLDQTHQNGDLFEYWAHSVCFIPIEDYPLFRPLMAIQPHWWDMREWMEKHKEVINYVMETIREKGPQSSADFPKRTSKTNGWWDWKEEKIALDLLWTKGDLMIPFRKKFQRYYDLQERVYRNLNEKPLPEFSQVYERLVEKTIHILGATRMKWIADYYRLKKVDINKIVAELLSKNKIKLFESVEFPEGVLVHSDHLDRLNQILDGLLIPQNTMILSPFDPLIWDRARTKELFNFDFTLECYLPQDKRKYGYFSLPILHNNQLVARMDCKAHRKEKIFEIKSFHFEEDYQPDDEFLIRFKKTLLELMEWHQTTDIHLPRFFSNLLKI